MSTKSSITVTDRYHNEMTLTFDGSDLEVEMNGTVELDESDRQKVRDFLVINS